MATTHCKLHVTGCPTATPRQRRPSAFAGARTAGPLCEHPAFRQRGQLPAWQLQQGMRMQLAGPVQSIPVSGPGASGAPAQPADSSVVPAGQISSALMDSMRDKIGAALETSQVVVQDVYGDGRHVSIDVVSPVFEGKTLVQRQRLVYKAIWLELQEAVHAVDAMSTKTPQEAGQDA